jgi:pyruvate/2-oxoglutarate dehydrogenase complex dihydrolipoamide acyltransferase (E2) component
MVAVRLADDAWQGVDPGTEALLAGWFVAEGARVQEGQPIAEVVLVKATLEVTAPADGTLARILVPKDGTFGPEQDLAIIE